LKGKRVFLRVDFNCPLDEKGNITDDTRIRASLPTIEYILKEGGIPIIASHLGKPKGKFDPKYSLKPIKERLSQLLSREVILTPNCIGEDTERIVQKAQIGDIILLENLRFHPEEEKNDLAFAQRLRNLADFYVNDAFGCVHRAHASVDALPRLFSNPVPGFLLEKEISFLSKIISSPTKPFVAIIGGAKISDKLGVIKNLLPKVDYILIGGGLAFNFVKAKGYEIGNSVFESDRLEEAKHLLLEAKVKTPKDFLAANKIAADAEIKMVKENEIPSSWIGVDIGKETIEEYKGILENAKTIVWAGPLGIFEYERFSYGTKEIAWALKAATERGATTVVGGGDTAAALNKFGLGDKISHISTGGGASLEFLEGKELPGIIALKR
ncbi:MAG: phosphoglycerate kinase, partial [candidate division WOR-3 bacterium]